jgi:hypothetical protein
MGAVKDVMFSRCQEWAEDVNLSYNLEATAEEVMEILMDEESLDEEFSLNWELREESFTDTSPREKMANAIVIKRIGMRMPCYGDCDFYKMEFNEKLVQWFEGNKCT